MGAAAALALLTAFTLGSALGRAGGEAKRATNGGAASGLAAQTAKSDAATGARAAEAPAGAAPEPKPSRANNRLLRRDGSVELRVAEGALRAKAAEATRIAASLGGQITASSIGQGGAPWEQEPSGRGSARPGYAQLTLRVPEGKFEAAVQRLAELGEATITTASEDVTSEYVDLEARLRQAKRVEARLLSFLSRAKTMGDVLQVQDRVDATQLRIEQLSAELKQLQRSTSSSTINVTLTEEAREAHAGLGGAIWSTLKHSCSLLAASARAVVLALTAALPFLLVLGALAGAGWWGWRTRRRKARAQKHQQAPSERSAEAAPKAEGEETNDKRGSTEERCR